MRSSYFSTFKGVLHFLCFFFHIWVWTIPQFHVSIVRSKMQDSSARARLLLQIQLTHRQAFIIWKKVLKIDIASGSSTLKLSTHWNRFFLRTPWRCRTPGRDALPPTVPQCEIQLAGHWRDALTTLSVQRGAWAETLMAADVERIMKTDRKRT